MVVAQEVADVCRTRSSERSLAPRSGAWSPENGVADGPHADRIGPWTRDVVSTARQAGCGRRPRRAAPTPDGAPRRSPGMSPAARAAVLERAADAALARRDELGPPAGARARQADQGRPRRDRPGRRHVRGLPPPRPGRSAARCCRSPAGPAASGNTAFTYRAPVGVALAITPFNAPANLLAHKLGRVVRGRQHHDRQATAAGAGRLGRRGRAAAGGGHAGRRRCRCCTAAARSAPRCAPRRRSASSASPAARPPARRWPARPAPSGSCWSSAATPRRSSARTPTSPRPPGSAPRTGYSNSGQSCISVQRVYVHRVALRRVRRRLHRARWRRSSVGDPLDPATDVGSMVDDDAAERVVSLGRARRRPRAPPSRPAAAATAPR